MKIGKNKTIKDEIQYIKEDKLFSISIIVFLVSFVIIMLVNLFGRSNINILYAFLYIVFLITAFIVMFAIYTMDIRKFNKEIKKIPNWASHSYGFPKELIFSILIPNKKLELDNLCFYENVYDNINNLNEKETLFAYTRVKFYKDPMNLTSTIISLIGLILTLIASYIQKKDVMTITLLAIFFGLVFLTWYFSNKEKQYICNILETFLNRRLSNISK